MLVFGIDVGLSGGIAALSEYFSRAIPMPIFAKVAKGSKGKIDIVAVHRWILDITNEYSATPGLVGGTAPLIGIEIQAAMPKQGVVSMFGLGESYGLLQGMALCTTGYRLKLIKPKAWKADILAGTQKDKSAAIQYVRAMYPDLDINVGKRKIIYHDGMADAVCIARYAAKQNGA